MKDSKSYVCEYQLYPNSDWTVYGGIKDWTQVLDYWADHVTKYPTEAVRIREVEMIEKFHYKFTPPHFEEKGQ